MPTNDIIDNHVGEASAKQNRKLADQIRTNLDSSTAAHFAVGYFFLSGFTAIANQLPHIKYLCLLIGNATSKETIEQIAQGYQQLELINDRLEAQIYPSQEEQTTTRTSAPLLHYETIENSTTLVKPQSSDSFHCGLL